MIYEKHNFILIVLEVQKSKINVPTNSVSEGPLSGL